MRYLHTLFCISTFAVLAFTLSSCKKQGCTDPDSLNFSATAEVDDGSCIYLADNFQGQYAWTDTITHTNPSNGEVIVDIVSGTGNIKTTGVNTVEMTDIIHSCATSTATVTETILTLDAPAVLGCFVQHPVFQLVDGKKLIYTYDFSTDYTNFVKGVAIKQ